METQEKIMFYIAPQVEVINIELTENILNGSGKVEDFYGEEW